MESQLHIGSAAIAAAAPRWEPAQSYPDPAVQTLDPRFERIKPPFSAAVERLATGFRWSEGPVWFGDGRCLLWSDIPNNRMMRWDEETGAVSVFRRPSNNANGNTRDRQGRLVTCEHERSPGDPHRIRRHHHRHARPLRRQAAEFAERRRGQIGRFDLVHRSAFRHSRQLRRRARRRRNCRPTSIASTATTGAATVVADDIQAAQRALLLARRDAALHRRIARGAASRSGSLTWSTTVTRLANGRVFGDAGDGTPDGFRCDVDGNLWCGWGMSAALNGVVVFAPDGHDDRPYRAAGALRQSLLRRAQAQPAVHGGQPVALFDLCQYRGRGGRLSVRFGDRLRARAPHRQAEHRRPTEVAPPQDNDVYLSKGNRLLISCAVSPTRTLVDLSAESGRPSRRRATASLDDSDRGSRVEGCDPAVRGHRRNGSPKGGCRALDARRIAVYSAVEPRTRRPSGALE